MKIKFPMLRVVPSFGLHLGVPVAATGMSGDQEKQPIEISPELTQSTNQV